MWHAFFNYKAFNKFIKKSKLICNTNNAYSKLFNSVVSQWLNMYFLFCSVLVLVINVIQMGQIKTVKCLFSHNRSSIDISFGDRSVSCACI